MAKVTGPLYSMGASGKIANAMVFFPYKGQNVVRQWLKPANPKSANQGTARVILGGAGRAASAIKQNEAYAGQLNTLGLIPGGQTKQSYVVKRIIDLFASDETAFEALFAEYDAHTNKAAFVAGAVDLSLTDVDVSYKGASNAFVKGLQVYVLAKLAIASGFTGAPYTTALASWNTTEVGTMVDHLIGA